MLYGSCSNPKLSLPNISKIAQPNKMIADFTSISKHICQIARLYVYFWILAGYFKSERIRNAVRKMKSKHDKYFNKFENNILKNGVFTQEE